MDNDFVTRERERLLRELGEFLSIPSVSTLPEHAGDCRAAAQWLAAELGRLGCSHVTLLEGRGHPVVWAESPPVEGKPTLLVYGHYDVQPPDPLEEWESPPFSPTVRDGNLFARGAADDKGQVFCLLKAYEAVRGPDGKPPLNVRFIFEGEEESGGHVIFDLLREEGGKTIYKVIPVDSPVREKVIRMFASHPLGEYQRGMLEFGLSVPNISNSSTAMTGTSIGIRPPEWLPTISTPPSGTRSMLRTSERKYRFMANLRSGSALATYAGSRCASNCSRSASSSVMAAPSSFGTTSGSALRAT